MLPPDDFYKNKQPQALPMAAYLLKIKQPRASAPWLSLDYTACKLTMNRRTPRINNANRAEESLYVMLKRVEYHQSCVSFLKNFSGSKCNTALNFPSSH